MCWWPDRKTLNVTLYADGNVYGGESITLAGGAVSRAAVTSFVKEAVTMIGDRKVPPVMTNASMSSSGYSVSVTFSGASSGTIRGVAGSVPCSAVFENSNLGTGAQCSWR